MLMTRLMTTTVMKTINLTIITLMAARVMTTMAMLTTTTTKMMMVMMMLTTTAMTMMIMITLMTATVMTTTANDDDDDDDDKDADGNDDVDDDNDDNADDDSVEDGDSDDDDAKDGDNDDDSNDVDDDDNDDDDNYDDDDDDDDDDVDTLRSSGGGRCPPRCMSNLRTGALCCLGVAVLVVNLYLLHTSPSRWLHAHGGVLPRRFGLSGWASHPLCHPRLLPAQPPGVVTALASVPGSGNTWVRHLLQQATGPVSYTHLTLPTRR